MTTRDLIAILVTAALLTGCAQSTPIMMKHPDGRIGQCGPFSMAGIVNQINLPQRERDCVNDYQRAGYERAPR